MLRPRLRVIAPTAALVATSILGAPTARADDSVPKDCGQQSICWEVTNPGSSGSGTTGGGGKGGNNPGGSGNTTGPGGGGTTQPVPLPAPPPVPGPNGPMNVAPVGIPVADPAPPPPPDPATLAQQALAKLTLLPPDIHVTPGIGMTGLVGLPVWLWSGTVADTWGPLTATAEVPGLAVTAIATVSYVEWQTGDGRRVVCGRGTPYQERYGKAPSPDCGHTYDRPSVGRPGEAFRLTATSHWKVVWYGGGQGGEFDLTRVSNADLRIGELQVLN